jgi:hypothetical protein
MPNATAGKAPQHVYAANIDLSEIRGHNRDGTPVPRYWGQKRTDGILFDSLTSRSISPSNAKPKVVLVAKATGVSVRNIAEEQRELRSVAFG